MTPASEGIERAIRTWSMTQDALKVVARELRHQRRGDGARSTVFAATGFEEASADGLRDALRDCQQAASDQAILSMWALFERRLLQRIAAECEGMRAEPASPFNARVTDQVIAAVEYWRIDEALDAIKPAVGGELVGQAKQIKRYRDWLAHRNPRKPSPAQIDPATASRILQRIVGLLDSPLGA